MSTESPQIGTEEYNQEMAGKFKNQSADHQNDVTETPPATAMPEGGKDKFYDTETGAYDWKSHAVEAEYRANGNKTPEPEKVEPTTEATPEAEADAITDVVTSAGLDPSDLQSQLQDTGQLSEEAYDALEKVGLPRELVSSYAENFVYRQQGQLAEATQYAGGEESWQQLSQWAMQNMPEAEVNTYNDMLGGNDWKVAIDAIKARRISSTGEPTLVNGSGISGNTASGYRSKAEMKVDMSNPKYNTDPAFRQDVMRKMQTATWDLEQ